MGECPALDKETRKRKTKEEDRKQETNGKKVNVPTTYDTFNVP